MKGEKQAFLDTQVLIYAFAENDPRAEAAEALLAGGGIVGVQTLNEFVAVAIHKLGMSRDEVLDALAALRILCPSPRPMTIETHDAALRIVGKYQYHISDALVIANALQASCSTLYSEDMQDGQVIEGLTIRNPFALHSL